MKAIKIAVLGAGPMGLAVAYQLAVDGYKPVIYEADDRVGGMAASFDFSGTTIERYYHFHCTSDLAFFNILKELNIEHKLQWIKTKMAYFHRGHIHPWGNPFSLLRFPNLSLVAKIRYGLHAFHSTKRKNWQTLDSVNAIDWIKKWIGQEAYEVLWSKLFDYKFYDYSNNLSAAWLWSRIRRIGQSRYNLLHEKLGYLEGGSDTLLDAISNVIKKRGGEIVLNHAVNKVVIENNHIKGLETKDEFIAFENVISTIPLPYVPHVMPDLPKSILAQFKSINNIAVVCVIVKLKTSVTPYFWLNINDPDMDIPGLVEYTNLRQLEPCIVYVPFYMPGEHPKYQEPDSVFLNKVKKYLKTINPTLNNDDFIELRASRYRYAQPICEPNFLQRLPSVKLPIRGLWVADTSYYYPEDRGISESIAFGRNIAKKAQKCISIS